MGAGSSERVGMREAAEGNEKEKKGEGFKKPRIYTFHCIVFGK